MADTSSIPTSLLLPIGPSMIGAGWSTVLTYPSLQTNWGFWQSPNNQYWGPSSRLSATLETGGANIYEIPGVPIRALTYAEGGAIGRSPAQVNSDNGLVAAAVADVGIYQNLQTKSLQQAQGFIYALADMPSAALGVYDHSSPYYEPPGTVWRDPAFSRTTAWPGDPRLPVFSAMYSPDGNFAGATENPVNGPLPAFPYKQQSQEAAALFSSNTGAATSLVAQQA